MMNVPEEHRDEVARERTRKSAAEARERAVAVRSASRETNAERAALLSALTARWATHRNLVEEIRRTQAQLRTEVCRYAVFARERDTPPERMLVALKDMVRATIDLNDRDAQELMADVVRWGIDAYYGGKIA